jgi:hypothetical protein
LQLAGLAVVTVGLFVIRSALITSDYRSLRKNDEFPYVDIDEIFREETHQQPVAPDEFMINRFPHGSPAHLVQPGDTRLEIALLMSYPNSGTSYTVKMIRHVSLTYTASNYGHENRNKTGPSLPVYIDQPNGPFWLEPEAHPEYSSPNDFVLTKTHCGMRCVVCPPDRYVETTFSFRRRCFSGKRAKNPGVDGRMAYEDVEYADRRVARAVHLIRDPFDNVVSRFHLERHEGHSATEYPKSRDGFRSYCQRMNQYLLPHESRATFLNSDVMEILKDVPCRSDFIRYAEWHNLAFATTHDMGLETFVLHYDEYDTSFNATVGALLEFLKLDARAEPEPFVRGKEYHDHFTPDERDAVRRAFAYLASKAAWKEMARYFKAP